MNQSINFVAQKLNITSNQVEVTLKLIEEGATVPFIARYRKAMTNNLNEEIIEQIHDIYLYNSELEKRKLVIIKILEESGSLTEEIKNKILLVETKNALENIYQPFKIGKITKASEAIKLGLEPLAKNIFTQSEANFNPYREAQKYLNEQVKDADFAIAQAQLIIAQMISQDISTREYIKNQIMNYGFIHAKIKKNAIDEKEKYKNYYAYDEKISRVANHRILALSRGEDEKVLDYKLKYNEGKILYDLNQKYFKIAPTGKIIHQALQDALDRLIYPSIEREIKSDLFEKAEKDAINLFANNLEQLLLTAAIKNKVILSIDPGFISGCKIAVLSPTGEVLHINKFFLLKENKKSEYEELIKNLVEKYHVNIIAIGNGTASRETETFISEIIKKYNLNISYAIVSEIGASVYSASKIAIEEFPDLLVEERSAINIGRKFQDPLNELVKIEPRSIGVGQYQHDLNAKELDKHLKFKVDKVVNMVGVDANSATKQILTYISGLNKTLADNFIAYRLEKGKFTNRDQIKNIKGINDKHYEQCIGFMRIYDSNNFYDKTMIHPEKYDLANQIVASLNIDLNIEDYKENIIQMSDKEIQDLSQKIDANFFDVQLIIEALKNPTKDIRDENDDFILQNKVLKINQIEKGMIFEGIVNNITNFGIFIYFGLKESAFIHISNLSDKFVKHPSEIVKLKQKVKFEIVDIDIEKSRIGAKLLTN